MPKNDRKWHDRTIYQPKYVTNHLFRSLGMAERNYEDACKRYSRWEIGLVPAASAQCEFMARNFDMSGGYLRPIPFSDAEYFPVACSHTCAALQRTSKPHTQH